MKTKIFHLLRLVIVSLVVGLISIKLADLGLLAYFSLNHVPERVANALVLSPYDGPHLQGRWHYVGRNTVDAPKGSEQIDYIFGVDGFFTDIDLYNPPPKLPNEYRIIWTGGSGAQGWAASDNAHMAYSILERTLQAYLPDRKIRVINLAMGASLSYQNFIDLNLWGHTLQPDLIISYSDSVEKLGEVQRR